MNTHVAIIIEKAQAEAHATFTAALHKFTEATGLVLSAVRWETTRAFDSNGITIDVEYHNMRSALESGASH